MMRTTLIAFILVCIGISATAAERLQYHEIQVDDAGHIIPWYSPDLGLSYDFCIRSVWNFWNRMEYCPNGVRYYLQHQVWKPEHDPRGLGGDQLAMALSSWSLLYPYLGDDQVVENMKYMADFALRRGTSSPDALWPNLLYPYNTELHSGRLDGDMRAGKGYLQPDKAGAFGAELVTLYQITLEDRYLDAAIKIADALADKIQPGDASQSPWPYRVHAEKGGLADQAYAPYTSNWTGALRLFEGLINMNRGSVDRYRKAYGMTVSWLKDYPLKSFNWGPFFEDIKDYSNTEINADTLCWFILEHPDFDPEWKNIARGILDWSQKQFGNPNWSQYGVYPINEQTAYMVPGNSHTSRHASVELIYADKTGDDANKMGAVRQLSWATYMVDYDGKNRYFHDDVWLTDGYGDYVRHYLRAMAAAPELAPGGQNHILGGTSTIRNVIYSADSIRYETWSPNAIETLRVAFEVKSILSGGKELSRLNSRDELHEKEGFTLNLPGEARGVLRVHHISSNNIEIIRIGLE
ncbi:MAG: hypothetical protein GC154_18920 [bacterium]|nr:hypothetical protein [bacterium]